MTLASVSQALRIRPAILDSLESDDYQHMPLKGHARNMVSAYARYLGLDPIELTEQFLREYHEYENVQTRSYSPYTTQSGSSTAYTVTNRDKPNTSGANASSSRGQGVRSMWDKPIPNSQYGSSSASRSEQVQYQTAVPQQRRRSTQGAGDGVAGSRAAGSRGAGSRAAGSRGAGSKGAGGKSFGQNSTNTYPKQTRNNLAGLLSGLFSNPVFVIISLIIVLVLILVVWAFASNSCASGEGAYVGVEGGAHITDALDDDVDPNATIPLPDPNAGLSLDNPPYGSFVLALKPEPGTGPWTAVTVDGVEVFNGLLTEPMSWEVNDKCEISTGQPSNLHVYRGDFEVTLDIEDGLGVTELKVVDQPTNNQTTNTPNE
jgi:hypothetical protein